jgi:hypothetical protein
MATVVRPADPERTSRGYERFAGQALAPVQASGEALFSSALSTTEMAHCAVFLRKLVLAGEPNHSAVLSVSSGTCVARGTSGVVRRVLWVLFPVPHRVLRLILVLKERLLDLSVNADEPFFCTSGTVPKIIRVCLKFACFFFGRPQL